MRHSVTLLMALIVIGCGSPAGDNSDRPIKPVRNPAEALGLDFKAYILYEPSGSQAMMNSDDPTVTKRLLAEANGLGNTVSGARMTHDIPKKQLQRAARGGAASLEAYVNQHDQVWYEADPALYARTIQEACQLAVNTHPVSKDSQLVAARMAELALVKPKPPAPALMVDILSFVRLGIAPDAQTRRRFTARWIKAWTQIEAVIDPDFDPRDKPMLNVRPPLGGHRAGIDPREIEDAEERAAYEEALAENQRKVAYHAEQNEYRRVLGKLRPRLIREIAAAYANTPEGRAELRELLDPLPQLLRDEILSAV